MPVEPISATPPRPVRLVTMRQDWRDVVFLHWEIPLDEARRHLPAGVEPDVFEGRTFVGLIGLGIRVALPGKLPLPYVGAFPEINVRLYSVDRAGRRGIVFCSLDAGRLLPTLVARAGYRLPYMWWAGRSSRRDGVLSYDGHRRWPHGGAATRFAVRTGSALTSPTSFDHFLTARWSLHWSAFGRSLWCAAEHQPWPLHSAELLSWSDELVAAAGLPASLGPPVSVLWSPGVSATIGPPRLMAEAAR
jgi:uncharacterized protein YqjF (DUF2071 family)